MDRLEGECMQSNSVVGDQEDSGNDKEVEDLWVQ